MIRRTIPRLLSVWMLAMLVAAAALAQQQSRPLLTKRVDPKEFGIQDYTTTVITSMAFHVVDWISGLEVPTYLFAELGRGCGCTGGVEYWASLDLPAGAVIDYIGLNTSTNTDAIMGFGLFQRDSAGNKVLLTGFSVPAHGWGTDLAGPLGIQVTNHVNKELLLNVEQAPSNYSPLFGWVEVWWRRTVSPAPGTATFNDVPTSHPYFQYIEAIHAAGITAGCGGGNFCPDQPITRKQEAAFIAKALGLHWPN